MKSSSLLRASLRNSTFALVGIVAAASLAACGDAADPAEAQVPASAAVVEDSSPITDLLQPKITTTVSDGAVDVNPTAAVSVTADEGALSNVTLTGVNGTPVAGVLSPDRRSWTATDPLIYSAKYILNAEAKGLVGKAVTSRSFATSSPDTFTSAYFRTTDNSVVGIGQPVAIQFDEPIGDRLAAQKAISVVTSPPVEGAFYWLSPSEVHWRPEGYWAPGTQVDVAVNTAGVNLGNGVYGEKNTTSRFTIGDAITAVVDDKDKVIQISKNGQLIKSMPTSMGKDDTPTDNGVYILGDRFDHMVMDSSTYGVPVDSAAGYRTPVDWATRMSFSGIFVHSAPWSVWAQGETNTSHGCLNVSPENAKWFFDNTKQGDVVTVKNTVGGTLAGAEGLGDWNIPWTQWKAGNADLG